jgi:hypothetical protein
MPLYVAFDSDLVLDIYFIDGAKKRGLLFISLFLFLFLFMSVKHFNYVWHSIHVQSHAKKGEMCVYLKN